MGKNFNYWSRCRPTLLLLLTTREQRCTYIFQPSSHKTAKNSIFIIPRQWSLLMSCIFAILCQSWHVCYLKLLILILSVSRLSLYLSQCTSLLLALFEFQIMSYTSHLILCYPSICVFQWVFLMFITCDILTVALSETSPPLLNNLPRLPYNYHIIIASLSYWSKW